MEAEVREHYLVLKAQYIELWDKVLILFLLLIPLLGGSYARHGESNVARRNDITYPVDHI